MCHSDNCYAPVYDETIKYFKTGALDPTTLGAVANIGLMAQRPRIRQPPAFEIQSVGRVRYILSNGDVLHDQAVGRVIWRSSTVRRPNRRLGASCHFASGGNGIWAVSGSMTHVPMMQR